MTDLNTAATVVHSIIIDVPAEHAFKVFTTDMQSWWPTEHHILPGELAEMVVEPHPGGAIFDRNTEGEESHWGQVIAYEPPSRFVFAWLITLDWQLGTDLARASEVEVRFEALGPSQTQVVVEHRHIDRHGDGWEGMRGAVDSEGGWPLSLRRLATYISTGSPA